MVICSYSSTTWNIFGHRFSWRFHFCERNLINKYLMLHTVLSLNLKWVKSFWAFFIVYLEDFLLIFGLCCCCRERGLRYESWMRAYSNTEIMCSCRKKCQTTSSEAWIMKHAKLLKYMWSALPLSPFSFFHSQVVLANHKSNSSNFNHVQKCIWKNSHHNQCLFLLSLVMAPNSIESQ